jgi:hypothetical protein
MSRWRVECALRDGGAVYAAVWESPTAFRWPKTGEIWTIRKDTGIWRIDQFVQNTLEKEASSEVPLDSLEEGETRILGDRVHMQELVIQGARLKVDTGDLKISFDEGKTWKIVKLE